MRAIEKKAEEAVWRAIEWSFVMGILSWLFVRLWIETLYSSQRDRAERRRATRENRT